MIWGMKKQRKKEACERTISVLTSEVE